jgi:hypothetical protein
MSKMKKLLKTAIRTRVKEMENIAVVETQFSQGLEDIEALWKSTTTAHDLHLMNNHMAAKAR